MPSIASNPSSDPRNEPETLIEGGERRPDDVESSASNPSLSLQDRRETLAEEPERRPTVVVEAPGSVPSSESDVNDDDDYDEDSDYGSLYASTADDDYDDDDDDDEDGEEEEEDSDDDSDDDSDSDEEEEEGENRIESSKQSGGGGADCPICFCSWDSEGRHRICCIPCGHIYGRSCLEKWLQRHQRRSAKCPQCNEKFKHKNIINLYAQLTAATTEGKNASASGERIEVQGEQQEWLMSQANLDMMCSKSEELDSKLDGLAVILEMLRHLEPEMKTAVDIIGEKLGKKIDENFHKLLELEKNPSDVSENPLVAVTTNIGAAPPIIEGLIKQIVDAVDERIGKKIDEYFQKRFEDYRNRIGFGSVPLASMPKDT